MAVNPLPFLANMPDPGQAFLQSFQQARAQRDQQIAQQSRQAQYAQWIERLRTDRSPETLSQFMLQFPEQADAIKKAFEPMDEANKRTQLDFYGQALLALNRGDTNFTKQLVQQRLDAAKNTPGQDQQAKELEYGLTQIDQNPEALKAMLAVTVQRLDPEGYKTLYAQKDDRTAFQQDYQFIKETFGKDAAAEFAQFGRGGVVSIPLGEGKGTYIGPPSMAPGAARWQPQQPEQGNTGPTAQGIPQIMKKASEAKTITQAEANVIKQSLGPNGQGRFNDWLKSQNIRVIVRTGTAPNGRRVVQYQDGTVEYGAD